jgi:hypothetical protein
VAGDLGGHLSTTPIVMRVYRPQRTSCASFAMDPPGSLVVHIAGRRAKLVDNGVALGRFAGRRWVDLELTGAPPSRVTIMVAAPCP